MCVYTTQIIPKGNVCNCLTLCVKTKLQDLWREWFNLVIWNNLKLKVEEVSSTTALKWRCKYNSISRLMIKWLRYNRYDLKVKPSKSLSYNRRKNTGRRWALSSQSLNTYGNTKPYSIASHKIMVQNKKCIEGWKLSDMFEIRVRVHNIWVVDINYIKSKEV